MAQNIANVYTTHTPINLSSIRNGVVADITRTSRESSIAAKYYYNGIRWAANLAGDPAARITPCPATVVFEAQFRSALSCIVEATVAEAGRAHAALAANVALAANAAAAANAPANVANQAPAGQGGAAAGAGAGGAQVAAAPGGAAQAAFDADAARGAARNVPANRLEAIALGAVRTSLVLGYNIADVDLRATERQLCNLELIAPAAAADADAYGVLMRDITRGWSIRTTANAPAAEVATMRDAPILSQAEAELAFALMSLGMAAPVRAGAQLFVDGHHYLSNAESTARHRAIEKEVFAHVSQPARDIWKANEQLFRNAVWHASIHSVSDVVLEQFAEDREICEKLMKTGYGSMAVGLPAKEDLIRRAEAYMTVYNQIIQTATAHGHTLNVTALRNRILTITNLPMRGVLQGAAPAELGLPQNVWPAEINSRAKAVKAYLEPMLNRAEPIVAWMFGFYKSICDDADIRPTSAEGSLLRSYSLRRAMQNYLGESNRAQTMYAARMKFLKAQASEGRLEVYNATVAL